MITKNGWMSAIMKRNSDDLPRVDHLPRINYPSFHTWSFKDGGPPPRVDPPPRINVLLKRINKSTFAANLKIFRDQEVLIDVTLACGGKMYHAHKFVLSTCSDYFKEMFINTIGCVQGFFVKDVTARDMEAILDFIYFGEVNVPDHHLKSLIKTAKGLQVKGLGVPDDPLHTSGKERISRDGSMPRLPSEPSQSPLPRRKRVRDVEFAYPAALGHLYGNISPQEPNSPYDLSQKSFSSSVSQSDIYADQTHSTSPDQPPHHQPHQFHQFHQPAQQSYQSLQCSQGGNKENSQEDRNSLSSTPQLPRTPHPPRTLQPPRTPHPSSMDINYVKQENDPMPGSSWFPPGSNTGDEAVNMVMKEDVSIDYAEQDCWGRESGGTDSDLDDDNGSSSSSGADHPYTDIMPPHHPQDNSPDTGLDLLAKPDHGEGGMLSPKSPFGPSLQPSAPPQSQLMFPGNLWSQDNNLNIEKTLQCPYCKKSFPKIRRHNLQVHLKMHTNERPFKCSMCLRAFRQKAHLKKHQKVHVGSVRYFPKK